MSIFDSLFDRISTTATEKITSEPNLVTALAGLDITNYFKSLVPEKAITGFNFLFSEGRVPFDVFEKKMHPIAKNIYPSATSVGLDDIIALADQIEELLTDEEVDEYNGIRLTVHNLFAEIIESFNDGTIYEFVLFLQENYSEYSIASIEDIVNDPFIDPEDVSLRDQLIDFREKLMTIVYSTRGIRFSVEGPEDIFYTIEQEITDYIASIDSLLLSSSEVLETIVESLESLTNEYTFKSTAQKSRSSDISEYLSNPFFTFVRSEYIKKNTTAIPSQASSIGQPKTNPHAVADQVTAAAAPNAHVAPGSVGQGDKEQEEQTTDTTAYSESVGPLNKSQYSSLREWLKQKESSGNPKAVNRYGYCGLYQFGAPALIDLGYVKHGTKTKTLAVASNWKGKNNMNSRDDFLGSVEEQNKAFLMNCRMNYKRMLSAGTCKKTDTAAHVGGLLAVCHLLGSGGAKKYVNGSNGSDANGTTAETYYKGASGAIGGGLKPTSVTEAQNNVNNVNASTIPDSAGITVPSSTAAPVYPYNNVKASASGHYVELDDTPGSERVNIRHRTGSGIEISQEGNVVAAVKGNGYRAVMGDDFIVVNGTCAIYVEGDAAISGANVNVEAREDFNVNAGGSFNVRAADMNITVDGNATTTVNGNSAETVGGFKTIGVDGDLQIDAASVSMMGREGNLNLLSKNNANLISNANVNVMATGSFTGSFGDTANMISKGKMIMASTADATFAATGGNLITYGSDGNLTASDGQTSIAGASTIALSHPVEKALYADTAGLAALGAPSPVTPSASSDDGGSKDADDVLEKNDDIEKTVQEFVASEFDDTMANSGGGEGQDPSTDDPISI